MIFMNPQSLMKKCLETYGKKDGGRLFEIMMKIHQKDFCVATAWRNDQISIARGCSYSGRFFRVSPDFKTLYALDGTLIEVETAGYEDIARHLPERDLGEGKRPHCYFDIFKKRKTRLDRDLEHYSKNNGI